MENNLLIDYRCKKVLINLLKIYLIKKIAYVRSTEIQNP